MVLLDASAQFLFSFFHEPKPHGRFFEQNNSPSFVLEEDEGS
jgi:hypothetical protein